MNKTLTRRNFLKMGAGALCGGYALALTGCGGGGAGGDSSTVTVFYDKATWPYPKMGDLASKAIGIDFKTSEYTDTTSYQQVIQSSLRSGETPGLFTWWSGYRLEPLAKEGGLQDLTSLWDTQIKDGNLRRDLRNPFTFGGKTYAVPNAVSYWPVFYNKRVFEEQGVTPPESWDDLISIADTLKKAGVIPFYATVDGRWPAFIWFEELLIRTDPDFYNRLMQGEASYTDPVVVGVMEEWKSLFDAGYFTNLDLTMDSSGVIPAFAKGDVAMIPVGTWFNEQMIASDLTPGEDYDFFVLPNLNPDLKENVVVLETGALAIPANAPDSETSQKVAEWWVSPKASSAWAKMLSDVPINLKSEVKNPMLSGLISTIKDGDYRLMQRYWEATLPQIVEAAVDQLARFMLNPDQYMDVLKRIDEIAKREWSNYRK